MTSTASTSEQAVQRDATWVSASVAAGGYRADLSTRGHRFIADEPRELGGTDAGPTPYELLLGALAACTAMTLHMYADRKRWPLDRVVVHLRSVRAHAADCATCESEAVGVGQLERDVELVGELTAEQRARLLFMADRCPVKQTLERGLHIRIAPPPTQPAPVLS